MNAEKDYFLYEDATLCCRIILLYCVNICHCDGFNKQTDWPVSEQDKVRQNSQTENDGKEERVKGDTG